MLQTNPRCRIDQEKPSRGYPELRSKRELEGYSGRLCGRCVCVKTDGYEMDGRRNQMIGGADTANERQDPGTNRRASRIIDQGLGTRLKMTRLGEKEQR